MDAFFQLFLFANFITELKYDFFAVGTKNNKIKLEWEQPQNYNELNFWQILSYLDGGPGIVINQRLGIT